MCVLVIGFNLLFAHRLDADATDHPGHAPRRSLPRSRPATTARRGSAGRRSADPDLDLRRRPGAGATTRRSGPDGRRTLPRAGPSHTTDVPRTNVRLYAAPFVRNRRRLGTLVAGRSPPTSRPSRPPSSPRSSSACCCSPSSPRLPLDLSRALRPVSTMTASARTWSKHDLDHRFNQGPPHDELTALADTLTSCWNAQPTPYGANNALRRDSHELRTPLARIATEAEFGLRRDRIGGGPPRPRGHQTDVRAMTRIIDACSAPPRRRSATGGDPARPSRWSTASSRRRPKWPGPAP